MTHLPAPPGPAAPCRRRRAGRAPGEAEGPCRLAWERVWGSGGEGSFGGLSRVGPGTAGFKPALWRVLAFFFGLMGCVKAVSVSQHFSTLATLSYADFNLASCGMLGFEGPTS